MNARTTTLLSTVAALTLQLALAGDAQAQEGRLYYDVQTELERGASDYEIEGMAWGYFHTGALSDALTLTANDPVAIQFFDSDASERYYGGGDDELQLWMSDTNVSAAAGESVRFEFFSVVPSDMLDAAGDEFWERNLELQAQFTAAPDGLSGAWNQAAWSVSGVDFNSRASTFDGYPAADHVVRLYYVYSGQGFSGVTPGNNSIPTIVQATDKVIWGSSAVSETMIDSGTNENIWDNGVSGRNMRGFILVENPSDREGLEVNLDFLELLEDDSPNLAGNDDDLLAEASSTAPADFNLGPGGTLMWEINLRPEFEAIEDARDFLSADGDLEPYAMFSVNGDPELDVHILPDADVDAFGEDLPPATFRFAAAEIPDTLPAAPTVTYSNASATYTVDEDIDISCSVTDNGGGVVFDTCADIYGPAWSWPAGSSSYEASAWDIYGTEGTGSVSFTVEVTYASLIAITERFVDHNGVENSLVQKIRAAERARNDNAQDGACQAYINQLEAQSGNHVDEGDADVLIYWAEQLMLQ